MFLEIISRFCGTSSAIDCILFSGFIFFFKKRKGLSTPQPRLATLCTTLQQAATRSNTLQHTATHGNTHYNTHCNTLQLAVVMSSSSLWSATKSVTVAQQWPCPCQCVAVCCSVLQCVAACCSVLQCVAVGNEFELQRV